MRTFGDEATLRGVGYNSAGKAEASMGVGAGDVDGDGRLDLFMTHMAEETNTLYRAGERGLFTDASAVAGLAAIDLPYTVSTMRNRSIAS